MSDNNFFNNKTGPYIYIDFHKLLSKIFENQFGIPKTTHKNNVQ